MSYELQSYPNRCSFSIVSERSSQPAAGKSFILPSIVSVPSSDNNDASSASATTATATVEDWMEEMQKLEEFERQAKITRESLPQHLVPGMTQILDLFHGYQRMSIYNICQAVFYDAKYVEQFIAIMNRIESIVKLPTILFIELLTKHHLHIFCLRFFSMLSSPAIVDFIQNLETFQGIELIELSKYQPEDSLIRMAEEIIIVGGEEMHKMYTQIKLSVTQLQHCALCKTKRIHQLELRMLYNERPADVLPIPAMLSQYEKPDVLAAPDYRYFSFDETLGKVFWHKHPVDLVNICDKCIAEVHGGVSNLARNEEYHHIDASVRSRFYQHLRNQENKLSTIIAQITHTRALRRLKEFLSPAYKHFLHGKAEEGRERARKQEQLLQKQLLEEKTCTTQRMLEKAMVVDQKWRHIDRNIDLKALRKRLDFASIQRHLGYNEYRPAPKLRRAKTSWRLNDYDQEGLPITAEAAQKEFGHEVQSKEIDELPDLDKWKNKAQDLGNIYGRRREEQRRKDREDELRKFEELKDYVRERTIILDRHHKQMERIAAQVEADRLAKRAAEREVRRTERFERYLEAERYKMQEEDRLSGEVRFYQYEKQREHFEQMRMSDEEMEQCERDRFWGIDYYENMMVNEELRLRKFYEDRVKYKNEQLVIMQAISKFKAPKFDSFGTLPEDEMYEDNHDRRFAVIKKLKAEEVRSKLKLRMPYHYSGGVKKTSAPKIN